MCFGLLAKRGVYRTLFVRAIGVAAGSLASCSASECSDCNGLLGCGSTGSGVHQRSREIPKRKAFRLLPLVLLPCSCPLTAPTAHLTRPGTSSSQRHPTWCCKRVFLRTAGAHDSPLCNWKLFADAFHVGNHLVHCITQSNSLCIAFILCSHFGWAQQQKRPLWPSWCPFLPHSACIHTCLACLG